MADSVTISDDTLNALLKAKQSQAAVKDVQSRQAAATQKAQEAEQEVSTAQSDLDKAGQQAKADAEAAVTAVRRELGLDAGPAPVATDVKK